MHATAREILDGAKAAQARQPDLAHEVWQAAETLRETLLHVDARTLPPPEDEDEFHDHVLRATEWTESLRDLVATVVETHLIIQGNRLNIITKKVTSWAAIIAVPTAIAGVYGMNFEFMPELEWRYGYFMVLLVIALACFLLHRGFKRNGWL